MPRDIFGTNASETIVGSSADENIYGRGGNDRLEGRGGDDYLFGGSGNDVLVGGSGFNDLWGDSGIDRFTMSARSGAAFSDDLVWDFTFDVDQIDLRAWGVSDFSQVQALLDTDAYGDATLNAYFGGQDHVLTVNEVAPWDLIASDFLYADPGALNQTGTTSDDVMFGSRFADTLRGDTGADVLLGGLGADLLNGGASDDDLVGGAGDDRLQGGAGLDLLQGDAGTDILEGGTEDDWLEGGAGNDRLVGGVAKDFMRGDSGADRFIFDDGHFGGATVARADVILDFSRAEGDRIDLAAVDARPDVGDDPFTFIGTAAFSGQAGQLRYGFSNGDTLVSGDFNGDRVADFMIAVEGQHNLVGTDFLL